MNKFVLLLSILFISDNKEVVFKEIAQGLGYATINIKNYSEYDGIIHILKINPEKIKPEVFISKELNVKPMTAEEWCKKFNLNIAINLGMYHKDYSTHVGYLKNKNSINNPNFNQYKSALLINPIYTKLPYSFIADLDNPDERKMIEKYKTVVQNLRLIKGNKINVWKNTSDKWPEAAIGTDKSGNLLLLFAKTPMSMIEFNDIILSLPIDIIKAIHTDGGPPSSLSVHYKDFNIDLSGNIISNNQEAIPNILGFRIKE